MECSKLSKDFDVSSDGVCPVVLTIVSDRDNTVVESLDGDGNTSAHNFWSTSWSMISDQLAYTYVPRVDTVASMYQIQPRCWWDVMVSKVKHTKTLSLGVMSREKFRNPRVASHIGPQLPERFARPLWTSFWQVETKTLLLVVLRLSLGCQKSWNNSDWFGRCRSIASKEEKEGGRTFLFGTEEYDRYLSVVSLGLNEAGRVTGVVEEVRYWWKPLTKNARTLPTSEDLRVVIRQQFVVKLRVQVTIFVRLKIGAY